MINKVICVTSITLKKNGERIGRTLFPFQFADYMKMRYAKLFLIEQPFSVSEDLYPTLEVWENGKLSRRIVFPLPESLAYRRRPAEKPDVWLRIRDFVSLLYFSTKLRDRIDLYVGWEFLNCTYGLFLRFLGIVDKVAYCAGDYMPRRFANPIANGIFHAMDRICAKLSDQVWNFSPVAPAYRRVRARRDMLVTLAVPEVARGTRKESNSVVYVGNLFPKFGLHQLLEGFRKVLPLVPDAKLHLIGEGEMSDFIRSYVSKNKLEASVLVHGRLGNDEADKIISSSKIGVAPYLIEGANSQFIWAEPSKVKVYLAHGIPVIVSKKAYSARYVAEAGAGLAIDCDENEIAQAIIRLLTDAPLYERCTRGAEILQDKFAPAAVFGRIEAEVFA